MVLRGVCVEFESQRWAMSLKKKIATNVDPVNLEIHATGWLGLGGETQRWDTEKRSSRRNHSASIRAVRSDGASAVQWAGGASIWYF